MRAHRPKYSELKPETRRRANARAYANTYQRRGKLSPKPCEVCNGPAKKFHDDFAKPLEVRWLCKTCKLTSAFTLPVVPVAESERAEP